MCKPGHCRLPSLWPSIPSLCISPCFALDCCAHCSFPSPGTIRAKVPRWVGKLPGVNKTVTVFLFVNLLLLLNPCPPLLPLIIHGTGLQPRISHGFEVLHIIPRLRVLRLGASSRPSKQPSGNTMSVSSVPSCLLHQAFDCLLFSPALLHGHIGQISSAMSSVTVCKADS